MRIAYILLSPTWGMHQYTADLANRMVRSGHEVHLITTRHVPHDRYAPDVVIHTACEASSTGFSPRSIWRSLRSHELGSIQRSVFSIQPDLVHFTGPHLWNPLLLRSLCRAGVPTVHTIHDLHPHHGAGYGRLLYLWNAWVRRDASHILVHGQRYRDELIAKGMLPSRVTCTPLTHLFLSYEQERSLMQVSPEVEYEPWALFLGRLEAYKGLDVLLDAARYLEPTQTNIVIAGQGSLASQLESERSPNVELRNRLIHDDEAVDLFRRCGLVILPYIEASQSALVAAAYFFQKPVVVTDAGALPEYVLNGETGWVIPFGDAQALRTVLSRALQAAQSDPALLARVGQAGKGWYQRQRKAEETTLQELYSRLTTLTVSS